MASYGSNPESLSLMDSFIGIQSLTVIKTVAKVDPSLPKGPTRSLRHFTKGVREKLNKTPVVDFRTDSRFQDVIQSCNDIKDVYLGVDRGVAELNEMLKKMKISNDGTIKAISGRVKFLNDTSHQIIQKGNENWVLLAQLESTTDFSSGASHIDKIEDNSDAIQSYIKAVQDGLQQYEEGKGFFVKDFIRKKLWLKSMEEVIKRGIDEKTPVNITKDELRVLCGCLREKDEESKIFVVVNTEEGTQKAAEVEIISKNQICVSHLEEMDLPPKSFFIEFKSLTPTPRRAFLDLSFEGTILSRIVISLQDEGYLPLYFLHMCTGDLGRKDAIDVHFEVSSTGNVVIRQSVGDVREMTKESEFLGVDWQKEIKSNKYSYNPLKEGDVHCQALNKKGGIGLIFKINTGTTTLDEDTAPSSLDLVGEPLIGDVIEGLDDLKEGILRYPNLERGDVTDSGFIVTF